MNATITKQGILLIQATSEIETFAMAKWIEENKSYNKCMMVLESEKDNSIIEKANGKK